MVLHSKSGQVVFPLNTTLGWKSLRASIPLVYSAAELIKAAKKVLSHGAWGQNNKTFLRPLLILRRNKLVRLMLSVTFTVV